MINNKNYQIKNSLDLIIRADADSRMGTGHIMRCLALAQAWKSVGGRVRFISSCKSRTVNLLLLEKGFELIEIEAPHPERSDLATTLQVIEAVSSATENGSPWVALDGYHFDPLYQKSVRDAGARVIVIDDYVASLRLSR